MSKKNDGGSAFPLPVAFTPLGREVTGEAGMTLRDYFAGQAIAGTLPGGNIRDSDVLSYARWAYRVADAMLAVRGDE